MNIKVYRDFSIGMFFFGLAVLSASLSPVCAADAVWVATNSASAASWYTLSNWADADGNALSVLPTNVTDHVTLAELPHVSALKEKPITTPKTEADRLNADCNPTIASLAGGRGYRIRHTQLQSGQVTRSRQMYIGNPDAFLGYLSVGDARASYAFGATSSYTPLVNNLDPSLRVGIDVDTAGTTVKVARVSNAGLVEKTGAGTMIVESTVGADNAAYLKAGTLELAGDGEASDEIDSILASALIHLDASDASTLVTDAADEEGLVPVARWNDVRGAAYPYATVDTFTGTAWYQIPRARAPYVAEEKSPTGLGLVSFGSIHGHEDIGPTNCLFKLSSTFKNVREAFAVILAPAGMANCTVFGDDGKYFFVRYTVGYLGATETLDDLMIDGVHRLNGMEAAEISAMDKLFVSAIKTTANAEVSLLGSDRYYSSRTGGFRLGEVILLGTAVTDAQRQKISRRLTEKWLGASGVALGEVVVAADTAISVPEGRKAAIGAVSASDGTLTKSGGGTLEIGSLQNGDATTVRLEGGSLAFGKGARIAGSAPAEGASIWLDASEISTFGDAVTHEGSENTYYASWKDRRDGNVQQAVWSGETTNEPFFVENAAGDGLHALSFGQQGAAKGSWMKLPDFGKWKNDVYAGFIVCRPNLVNFTQNIFGSTSIDMRRELTEKLLSDSYVQAGPCSALWTVNGVLTDPHADLTVLTQTSDFVVIAFSAYEGLRVDTLCKDRYDANYYKNGCGGLQIGELILYKRRLTAHERASTEAYLMDKWLGAKHPDDSAGGRDVKALVCGDTASLSVSSENALDVDEVTGGNGAIVKEGAGTMTVGTFDAAVSSVDVRGGVLEFSPATTLAVPRFRFDASNPGTMEYTVADNGDGTAQTNVTKWLDADGNGFSARAPATLSVPGAKNGAIVSAYPTLVSVTTREGVVRNALDFGPHSGYYTKDQRAGTAGMTIYQPSGSAVSGSYGCIREAFIVWQDREDVATYGYSHLLNDSAAYHYHRNGAKILTSNAHTKLGTRDGYVAVDGEQVPYNTALDLGVHVVNFAPTNVTAVNRLVWDRTSNAGGGRVFELVCFTESLTAAQRKYIERSLMNKWLGTAAPVYTNFCSSVRVAAGAKLRMTSKDVISAEELVLGGVIEGAAAVAGVSSLTVPCVGGIPVSTVQAVPIGFKDGTVAVTLDGFDVKAFVKAGLSTVTLLEAPSFGGVAVFKLVNDTGDYRAFVKAKDGKLMLTVLPHGTCIIVR